MPGADYYSEGVLTSLGWFDPLEVFYDQMVGELREICSGHSSVGDYGSARSKMHVEAFGKSDVAQTLLRMEEHAFYVTVTKLTATVAMSQPDRLSPEQRLRAGAMMSFCPGALKTCLEMGKKDFQNLPSQDQVQKVIAYCLTVCDLTIPLWTQQVPVAPSIKPTHGMSRQQMAALLV